MANSIVTSKGGSAGYFVFASNPGSTIAVQSTWLVPSVTCTVSGQNIRFTIGLDHITSPDSGSELDVSCSPAAQYMISDYIGGFGSAQLPAPDTVSAGDKMQTIGTITVSTGKDSITIKDLTKGWTFINTASQSVNTMQSGEVDFILSGSDSLSLPLPAFTAIKTSGDSLTLGNHHGSLGSFLPISSDTFTKGIMIDSVNSHVIAKPTSVSSTSTGFSIKWIQGS